MQTTFTHGLNAVIEGPVTENLVPVDVFLDTMVLLASVTSAPTTVTTEEPVGLRSILRPRRAAHTQNLGML